MPMQPAELPLAVDQTEHVYVAAHLDGTYGSLMLYTTPEEKGRVQERGAADIGNIIGYATYTVRSTQQPTLRSQRLGVSMKYTSASELRSDDIEMIVSDHRAADLVQLIVLSAGQATHTSQWRSRRCFQSSRRSR